MYTLKKQTDTTVKQYQYLIMRRESNVRKIPVSQNSRLQTALNWFFKDRVGLK